MKMNPKTEWMRIDRMLAMLAIVLAFALCMNAQEQKNTTTTAQPATREVQVENAEIIYLKGNDVILRMSDGSIRHISNVPDSTRVLVDGKEIGIKDAKVGMKLQRTITTTTIPQIITTVQTVKGSVFSVQPPNSVVLTLENGENQQFTIPEGQKFMVDGEETDAFALKKGMMVSATKIIEEPITVIEQQSKLTGEMPPPPVPPSTDLPLLIAMVPPPVPPVPATPPAPSVATEKAPKELPQTGSELPLLGVLGSLSLLTAAGLALFRRIRR